MSDSESNPLLPITVMGKVIIVIQCHMLTGLQCMSISFMCLAFFYLVVLHMITFSIYEDSHVIWKRDGAVIDSVELSASTGHRVKLDAYFRVSFKHLEVNDSGHYACYVDFKSTVDYFVKGNLYVDCLEPIRVHLLINSTESVQAQQHEKFQCTEKSNNNQNRNSISE